MMQLNFGDITKNKHKGNQASVAANPRRLVKQKMRGEILHLLKFNNLTGKQIADLLNVPFNSVSGRFSELKANGLICGTGERVEGSEILRLRRAA